jgi:diacylglycerol kinase (ATP)
MTRMTSRKRLPVLIVANPQSGGGRARRLVPQVAAELHRYGFPVEQFESRGPGEIIDRVRTIAEPLAAVLVVGGDGTVREALAGGLDLAIPLAVLPCGSANVLGSELRLPRRPAPVARLIADGYSEVFDSGRLEHVGENAQGGSGGDGSAAFLLMVGAGIDARVVNAVHRLRRGGTLGKLRYIGPAIAQFLAYRAAALWVTADDGVRHGPFAQVLITNVQSYGALWKLPGGVDMQDGLLDVLGFRARGRVGMFWHALLGTLNLLRVGPNLWHAQVRQVTLSAEPGSPIQVDGDPGGSCPVLIRVEPASVRLMVPARRTRSERQPAQPRW